MRTTPSDRILRSVLAAGLAVMLAASGLRAQETRIVSSEISISGGESTLALELSDESEVSLTFRDGTVYIDGEASGSYEPRSELERSWRELLERAMALDDGPLAEALVGWAPPGDLEGEAAAVADRVDARIEGALGAAPAGGAPAAALPEPTRPPQEREEARDPGTTRTPGGREIELRGIAPLLRSMREIGSLGGLADVLEDLDLSRVRIYAEGHSTIEEDETVEATVLVVDGDLDVYGRIDGDVLVIDGDLTVHANGRIDGKVRLVDGDLDRRGGIITGSVRELDEDDLRIARETDVGADLEREIERRIARRLSKERSWWPGPFRYIAEGLGGIFQTAALWTVLAGLGFLLVYFGRERLELIADTARYATGRAAMVGMAGAFLSLPVYVLGAIALAVSIVGIPVLLAWLPLFPVAVALAAVLGYVSVGHSVGEYIAQQRFNGWEWLRRSNSYYYVLSGLAALLAAFAVAHVIHMAGPWLGFLHGIVMTLGILVTLGAVAVGFGAVLLTRGGRLREFAGAPAPAPPGGPDLDEDLGDARAEGDDA